MVAFPAVPPQQAAPADMQLAPRPLASSELKASLDFVAKLPIGQCVWPSTDPVTAHAAAAVAKGQPLPAMTTATYEARRRLGAHHGTEGVLGKTHPPPLGSGSAQSAASSPATGGRPFYCVSAQQTELAAQEVAAEVVKERALLTPEQQQQQQQQQGPQGEVVSALLQSLVHTDAESGYKSVSLGRLVYLLAAAQKEALSRLEAVAAAAKASEARLNDTNSLLDSRLDGLALLLYGDPEDDDAGDASSGSGGSEGRAERLEVKLAALEAKLETEASERKALEVRVAAAEAKAAADDQKASEAQELQRYYLEEVRAIEGALRTARVSAAASAALAAGGQGDPAAAVKLSAADRATAREQAMASVRERKEELARVRSELGAR
jgi:hypothetical protein